MLITRASASPELCLHPQSPELMAAYILIIEDSPTQAMLLRHLLEPQAYSLMIVSRAAEAWARIRAQRPALIICDYLLPDMNGQQLYQQLQQHPDWQNIPFILMACASDLLLSQELAEADMPAAFIQKPVARQQLEALLKRLLPSSKPTHPAAPPPSKAHPLRLKAGLRAFNGAYLLENIGHDLNLYREIVEAFLAAIPQRQASLQRALAAENRREIALIAHALESAAMTLGAERLRAAAQIIEKAAPKVPWKILQAQLLCFVQELEQLQKALQTALTASADPSPR